jgi:hypothetical protein
MSTNYVTNPSVPFKKVKGLAEREVWEIDTENTTDTNACLTDGTNYFWAYRNSDGSTVFTRWAGNWVRGGVYILEFLAVHFDTRFISEHELYGEIGPRRISKGRLSRV